MRFEATNHCISEAHARAITSRVRLLVLHATHARSAAEARITMTHAMLDRTRASVVRSLTLLGQDDSAEDAEFVRERLDRP